MRKNKVVALLLAVLLLVVILPFQAVWADSEATAAPETEKAEKTVTYTITKGGNGRWRMKSGKNWLVIVKRSEDNKNCLDHFVSVKIDGTVQPRKYYYLTKDSSGSTDVSIKAAALGKLTVGKHTFTIAFDDGEVNVTVEILKAKVDTTRTADESHMFLWLGLTAFGCMGLVVLQQERKRRLGR